MCLQAGTFMELVLKWRPKVGCMNEKAPPPPAAAAAATTKKMKEKAKRNVKLH